MNLPQFLAFEVTDVESGYPYAAAWSLPDGQYKSVLIRPEEDWLIDFELGQFNPDAPALQDLLDKGESVLDILKEWAHDLECSELYCADPIITQYCLDLMHSAYESDCPQDVISEYELYEQEDTLDIDDQRRWIMDTEGLSATHCEDAVKAMIFVYARVNDVTTLDN